MRTRQRVLARVRLALVLLACLVCVAGAARFSDVALGPQWTVFTVNPKIGVHTRLTDEVEPAKIKRTLEMVREMGASWIVEYFPWAYIEPLPGIYDWTHADLVVDHANRQGLTVVARLGMVPQWARPEESVTSFLDPTRYADFARFVGDFAAHFSGRVDYIVVWNEPNLAMEWGYRNVSPEEYTQLLGLTYRQARAANPRLKVLAGALAPTLAQPGNEWGMDDVEYLRRMLAAGAADYFDILAVHSYGWVYPPDMSPDPDVINFRRVELLHQLLVERGCGGKSLMVTEGGWNDHPRWTRAVKPAQRIQYTVRAYQMAEQWEWCQAVALWAFRYPWAANSYLDYFAFVTPDFVPKPVYLEVQGYAHANKE